MIFPLVTVDAVLWPSDSVATMIPALDLPHPYRGLLAHHHHMTVTVEEYYHDAVDVRVLASDVDGAFYHREIVLTLRQSRRIVQHGLVRINLDICSPPVREAILQQQTPLGRILIEHNILRRIEPTAFIKVQPGKHLQEALALTEPTTLYGRTGVIFFDDLPAIAVLEILAPVA